MPHTFFFLDDIKIERHSLTLLHPFSTKFLGTFLNYYLENRFHITN